MTEQQLKLAMPGILADNISKYLPELNKTLPMYGISTPIRVAHFLSQVGHESNDFASYRENLNYSEDGLLKTFKSDFDVNHDRVISDPEKVKAKNIAHKQDEIANFVYANQNGNGNEATGDGSRFKGRGCIQITGEDNYKAVSLFIFKDMRLLEHPELLELPQYGVLAACWYWSTRNLNSLADKDDIISITKKINGGTNGIEDRKLRLINAKRAFKL